MAAYYNEIDPYAADWLRNLIKAGHIADGEVDTRSIIDVQPDDIRHFDQCHFFAGIAGWSHALRLAGWADNRKIWTGSCPCQPFSVAGKGKGTDDERHLWPHFFRLIRGCRPPVVMGEQVAGAAGYGWLDGVRSDLEGEGYAIEGVDIPACAANAPHIRSRLYWISKDMGVANSAGWDKGQSASTGMGHGHTLVAGGSDSRIDNMAKPDSNGHDGARGDAPIQRSDQQDHGVFVGSGGDICSDLANTNSGGCESAGERGALDTIHARELHDGMPIAERDTCGIDMANAESGSNGDVSKNERQICGEVNASGYADSFVGRSDRSGDGEPAFNINMANAQGEQLRGGHAREPVSPSSSNEGEAWQRERLWPDAGADGINFWDNAIWLNGADGKTRRAESNIRLLAHGVPARVGKLRAYGNAIVPPLAAEVIKAFMESQ